MGQGGCLFRALAGQLRRAFQGLDRLRVAPLLDEGAAQEEVGHAEIRIQLQGVAVGGHRLVVAAGVVVGQAQAGEDHRREGIQVPGPAQLVQGLLETPRRHQAVHRVPMAGQRVSRIQLPGLVVARLRLRPVPLVHRADAAERRVGVSQRSVEVQGSRGGFPGPGHDVPGGRQTVDAQQRVAVGHAGPGPGVVGGVVQGLTVQVQGALESLLGALVGEVPAFQVQVVGLRMLPAFVRSRGSQVLHQGQLERFDDVPGDLLLDGEDVDELPVEAFRPQVVAALHVDELAGHPQA